MCPWNIPHEPPPDYEALLKALPAEASDPVLKQHVVTKAIFRQFAAMAGKYVNLVVPYDVLEGREEKATGPKGCGVETGFIPYGSVSAESVWKTVEDNLTEAINAARQDRLHGNPVLEQTLKDCIALHMTRSYRYMTIHAGAAARAAESLLGNMMVNHPGLLEAEFHRRTGLYATGPEGLAYVLARPLEDWYERMRGPYARVSIESTFGRIREIFRQYEIEVGHATGGSELLISDSPAISYQLSSDNSTVEAINLAIGDSNGTLMPVAPDCIVGISPAARVSHLSRAQIDTFNHIQVLSAARYVYYRPESDLRAFAEVARAAREGQSASA